ncbi:hypothetical protein ENKNEFLB_02087 [Nocardioides aquaticus]|uniref:Tail assembly chaperone n=1 Tax=Nocardioides aquaticus TaxID=160826 RepID=A0ABX8EKR3_9ACTN|nr:hypothetical protein [Nocardioides aquaticus]QVT79697.1 hypothetical protein ENKNEFLB_02087 [Nocardioides aquaticus]
MAAVQRYTVTVPPFVARAAYDPRNGDKPNQILIHTGEGDPIDLSGLAVAFLDAVEDRTHNAFRTADEAIADLKEGYTFEMFQDFLLMELDSAVADDNYTQFPRLAYQVALMAHLEPLAPFEREAWMAQVHAGVDPVTAAKALHATNA